MLIVLTTVLSADEAASLAEAIVTTRLAACVQILPQMTSVYVWEGKLQKEGEHLLLIKTLPEKYDELEAFITANHTTTCLRSWRSTRKRLPMNTFAGCRG